MLDDLSTGKLENLGPAIQAGATVHRADVTDVDAVAKAFATVRPTSSTTWPRRSTCAAPSPTPATTRGSTSSGPAVLEQSVHSGVSRFVMASTGGAIYGDATVIPTPETAPALPLSPYAVSKAAAESYVEFYARDRGLSARSCCGWPTSTGRVRIRAARPA